MAKEAFQLLYVYLRQHIEPSVGHEAAVCDETVEVGVKVNKIAKGLDRNYNPRDALTTD